MQRKGIRGSMPIISLSRSFRSDFDLLQHGAHCTPTFIFAPCFWVPERAEKEVHWLSLAKNAGRLYNKTE